jgi:hypothetical protein
MDCRQIYHVLTVKYKFLDARTTITLLVEIKKKTIDLHFTEYMWILYITMYMYYK